MKSWVCIAAVLLSCSFQAIAQGSDSTQTVGAVVDVIRGKFVPDCQAARDALAIAKGDDVAIRSAQQQLMCKCFPEALDAAYPVSLRSTRMTEDAFKARLSGGFEVCMARTVRFQMSAVCDKGKDPFARSGEPSTPARTAARCTCARAELAKRADLDLAQASNDSAARYAALLAAATPGQAAPKTEPPTSFVDAVGRKCGAIP